MKEKLGLTIVKVRNSALHSVILMSDGNLYACGENNEG